MRREVLEKTVSAISTMVFVLILTACGGNAVEGTKEAAVGDASQGEELYQATVIGAASAPGCITCHSLEEGVTLVGPSHAGIGAKAAEVVQGLSAEDYLKQSIIDPDAHISEGYNAGAMYANYGRELTDQEIADLAAFLLSLK